MKLLQRTGSIYIIVTAVILVLAGMLIYFHITSVIDEEVEEKLYVNKVRITKQLEKGQEVTDLAPVIEVHQLNSPQPEHITVTDTFVYDPREEEEEFFKEITSIENINGSTYRITVRQVILEPHDYLESIGIPLAIVFIVLLIILFLVNRYISMIIWRPFYKNLEILRNYSIEKNESIQLKNSGTEEFNELNQAVTKLTNKIRSDYVSLKEFSENASHEMQTPLAIIQSKIEEALQDPNLSARQANYINAALAATQRLTKLNKSLLILTRIENRQYAGVEKLDLSVKLESILADFEEYFQTKEIKIKKSITPAVVVNIDPLLADMLLSNLLSNAIKHNYTSGQIEVILSNNSLTISNTSSDKVDSPERMFERFHKVDPSSASLGLGLSIVKKICEINEWKIIYTTEREWHRFEIEF